MPSLKGNTVKSMPRIQIIALVLLVVGMNLGAHAQTNSQSDTAPAPAFGQPNTPILSPESPPVSGLDEPALELRTATRSFISPGLQVSESADTNPNNQLGSADLASITRILGAFDLQQFWPKSDLFAEYVGGAAFYSNPYDLRQLHAAGLEGVTRWRTGRATFRDAFSYLPDGAFNLGFGGTPGYGIAVGQGLGTGALPGSIRNDTLGSVGNIPRLSNTAILDAVQAINPISAITVAAAFNNAHYYDPTDTLLNSDQVTVQAGYARLISRHDQVGFVYAFQLFQFPQTTGGQVFNNIVNVRWSHTISGRMNLVIGAGPQFTLLEQGGYASHASVNARVQLHYKFQHSSMVATYEKFTSAGSGFFGGADTQTARWAYIRPLGRTWEFHGDLSYSHNHKLQELGFVNATTYDEGSALAVFRKHIGRTYDFFVSYRFSEVGFNAPLPAELGGNSGNLSRRQAGTIGVEWHPTPTRIE